MPWRFVLALIVLGATFVVGIGVGEAIHDQPSLGGEQTIVRTLSPTTISSVSTETVTVTTSNR